MTGPSTHDGEGGEPADPARYQTSDWGAALLLGVALALVAASWYPSPRLDRAALAALLVRAETAGITPLEAARREGIAEGDLGHAAWWYGDAELERRVAAGLGRPDPVP